MTYATRPGEPSVLVTERGCDDRIGRMGSFKPVRGNVANELIRVQWHAESDQCVRSILKDADQRLVIIHVKRRYAAMTIPPPRCGPDGFATAGAGVIHSDCCNNGHWPVCAMTCIGPPVRLQVTLVIVRAVRVQVGCATST